MFYPGDPGELLRQVEGYLAAVSACDDPSPKAIIAPHAGYIYSGPIAAHAYARIRPDGIRRVVLLGPAHRVLLYGVGASSVSAWRTPLGDTPVELPPNLPVNDAAHLEEHSLEVQLPFLQVILSDFTLTPLVVGDASGKEVSDILESLWGGPETLIVISSDLSHYENYETANRMDTATSKAIVTLDGKALKNGAACGRVPIAGLLQLARKKGMTAKLVNLRNSGDTAGSHDQVVGYGAYAFYE
jgi:AmmeMemoRadiSam system protein B